MTDYQEEKFCGVWYYKTRETGRWIVMSPQMLLAKLTENLSTRMH